MCIMKSPTPPFGEKLSLERKRDVVVGPGWQTMEFILDHVSRKWLYMRPGKKEKQPDQ